MEKLNQINHSQANSIMENNKKWLTRSNITTAIMVVFIGALLISPQFKGAIIQGLMKIGLFQPSVPEQDAQSASPIGSSTEAIEEMVFKDENGKTITLSDLKGKAVFVNFWATWCPPCIAEMPSINKLSQKFKDKSNVVFLMVDMDADMKKSQKFMQKNGYDLNVYAPASQISPAYFAGALPTTLLFDKSGKLVFKHEGGADYGNAEFKKFLEATSLKKE
ncbi:TlpA disulfide reductase family protein [Daejeonella sp. JGW-45]|uniref:TlpA family protein disulfide reductase n=1 Tax=Daejeonella sp. JGW-45 TaxID=3034148 RepID=UPI0023EB000F|nr:TlpA disulfide reductase family protein [Daejeonella sp. JGW-45]